MTPTFAGAGYEPAFERSEHHEQAGGAVALALIAETARRKNISALKAIQLTPTGKPLNAAR